MSVNTIYLLQAQKYERFRYLNLIERATRIFLLPEKNYTSKLKLAAP